MLTLPLPLRSVFYDVSLLFNEIERLQVKLSLDPAFALVDKNIFVLQKLLLKPGKSFSPEMISALVLASPFLQVPITRKVGIKGFGPLWLEEPLIETSYGIPSSAGVLINDLVNVLHAIWNKAEIH